MAFLGVIFDLVTAMMMLGFLGLMFCRLRMTCYFGSINSSHTLFAVILNIGEIHANDMDILCLGFWMDIAMI